MGAFRNANFVNEFAYRTKLNYFYQKKRFSSEENDKNNAQEEIDKILHEMRQRKFSIEEYYSVTDLINSLVGLLVFPEQATYHYISDKEDDMRRLFPELYKCMRRTDYRNTYIEDQGDKESPKNIIRHLRNALSHNKVMIIPRSATVGNKDSITAITFRDEKGRDAYRQEFSLTIEVADLETVVMEICDYLISIRA